MHTHSHRRNPEKYYLTVPLEKFPRRFGTHIHPSPRHITLVPWFTVGHSNLHTLITSVGSFCSLQEPFDISFGTPELFGPDESTPVQRVVLGRERVVALHIGLLAIVNEHAHMIDESYAGSAFDPHSTTESHGLIAGTQLINIRSVLAVAKYTKDERCATVPDKEFIDGFRLGIRPSL